MSVCHLCRRSLWGHTSPCPLDNVPMSRSSLITSAKSLSPCKVTYSQVAEPRMWTSWGAIILPPVDQEGEDEQWRYRAGRVISTKPPEAGKHLVCSGNQKDTRVVGMEPHAAAELPQELWASICSSRILFSFSK